VRNSYHLRFAAISHLFTNVLPIPLPPDNSGAKSPHCFWTSSEMRHETQTALLHSLGLLARHLACACLSLRPSRALDAERMIAFACIAAIADAVMRTIATDVPSQVQVNSERLPFKSLSSLRTSYLQLLVLKVYILFCKTFC
jgi:hypothetical protein